MRKCNKCQIEKQDNDFHKSSSTIDGLYPSCKSCRKEIEYEKNRERALEWYKNNTDKVKEYCENNKEKLKEYRKEYRNNNKEERNEKGKLRRQNDPLYKLECNIRSSITKSLKKNGYKKNTKTHNILGCSFEEFRKHLEDQFEPWMTWGNYGKYNGELNYGWDIDHKKPLSNAKTQEELIELSHFDNLQPLCSYINRVLKRDKIEF